MTTIKRYHSLDVLKGMAIFLVVMGHVLTMCIRGLDRAAIFKIIGEVHMPLFFFISGFLSYKEEAEGRAVAPNLLSRARQLLLPMVAVSSIWIYYFPHSGLESPLVSTWHGLWYDTFKNGYWFTLVLFEVMLVYWLSLPFLRRFTGFWGGALVVISFWGITWLLWSLLPESVISILSFGLTARFIPVFLFGVLARRHIQGFNRICCNGWFLSGSIITAAFTLYYSCWYWEFPMIPAWAGEIFRSVFHIALAVVAISVATPWCESQFEKQARPCTAARLLQYLGKESLVIYLFHYFFLFPMGFVRPVLESMSLGFTPLFFVSAVSAACVICLTLGVAYIIKQAKPLAVVLTGAKS